MGHQHISTLGIDEILPTKQRVSKEDKKENMMGKKSINKSKESEEVTKKKWVTGSEIVEKRVVEKRNENLILLKQSNRK